MFKPTDTVVTSKLPIEDGARGRSFISHIVRSWQNGQDFTWVRGDAKVILIFHGIGTPSAHLPADEPPFWIERDHFVAIIDLVAAHPSRDRIVLTFDDGNVSDLAAAKMLAARGMHGKFFVLSGRLGMPGYLDRDDLRTLRALGMEVGLHGSGHIDWRTASDGVMRDELIVARQILADAIGAPIESVAIPFGYYNRRVLSHLAAAGFSRIYSSDKGVARPEAFLQRRNVVKRETSLAEIADILNDRASFAMRARRTIMPVLKRTVL